MWEGLECNGGLRDPALPQGRAGASLSVSGQELVAVTSRQERFALPLYGLWLERGGASGRMWLCRHDQYPDRLLYSEDRAFPAMLRQGGEVELNQQLSDWEARTRRRSWLKWVLLLVITALLVAVGFAVYQLLVRSVDLIPSSVDAVIGEQAFAQMQSQLGGPVVADPDLIHPVQATVDRMATVLDDDHQYRVHLVDADLANAFALPGGHLVVYGGLLDRFQSGDELAAVLAHELAHVHHRHGLHRIVRVAGIGAGVALVFGDASGVMAVAVELLSVASINAYSRDQEREADATGQQLLARVGYPPEAMAWLLQTLQQQEELAWPDGVPPWLSSHPDTAERLADAQARAQVIRIDAEGPPALDWPRFRAQLAKQLVSVNAEAAQSAGNDDER
jgi:beta-barrel assembly-enhancing protease